MKFLLTFNKGTHGTGSGRLTTLWTTCTVSLLFINQFIKRNQIECYGTDDISKVSHVSFAKTFYEMRPHGIVPCGKLSSLESLHNVWSSYTTYIHVAPLDQESESKECAIVRARCLLLHTAKVILPRDSIGWLYLCR